jgi:hypothetical protein
MHTRVLHLVGLALVFFCVGLGVAISLKPAGLATNDGISYYGIYTRTFASFAIGLLGAACSYWLAAFSFHNPKLNPVKYVFLISSALTIVIVLTPYTVNRITDDIHTTAGSILFSLQLALSFWLVHRLHYLLPAAGLALLELAAGIACAVYLGPTNGFLIQAQILFQLTFGGLLLYSLPRLLQTAQSSG